MKIEILEEFVIFAKYLSFTKAAEEMYMTQPALSMHMTALEKELGFKLIERGQRSSLTLAGQAFLTRCQELIELYHVALTEGRLMASSSPPVRILDQKKDIELHLLTSLTTEIPFTLLDIGQDTPLWEAIERDIVDVGIGLDYSHIPRLKSAAKERGLSSFPIGAKRIGICIMKAHPLAKRKTISTDDLYDYPIGIGARTYYDEWQDIINGLVHPKKPLRFRLDPVDGESNYVSFDLGDRIHFYMLDVLRSVMQYRDDIVIFEKLDGRILETLSVIVYNAMSENPNVHAFVDELKRATADPSYPPLAHSSKQLARA